MSAPAVARPIKVLLVEDNPGDARLILEMLREVQAQDFELERLDRLETALDRFKHAGLDIVLLDLGLPDSQGMDTFWQAQHALTEEPIVIISGLDDERVALEAVRAGAQDYLVKGRIEGQLLARVIHYAIERKRAEARLSAIVRAALDAHVTMDAAGAITGWNPQAEAVFGWPASEAIGRPLADVIIPPAHRQAHWTGLARFLSTGEAPILNRRLELTALRSDGREFPVELAVTPIRVGDAWWFSAFIRDITDRKAAEQALRASEEKFASAFRAHPSPMAIAALADGRWIEVNESLLRLTGLDRDEVIGRSGKELGLWQNIELRDRLLAQLRDGRPFHDVEVEWMVRSKAIRAGLLSAAIVSLGGESHCLLQFQDITERKQLEQQLRQSQRMEAVGRLAGGVAHDFNNLLTAIFGYADLLAEELPEASPGRKDIDEIRKAGQRAASLTRQLLAFSRQQVLQPVVLNMNDLVEDIQAMLRRLIGEDVELRTTLAPDAGNVRTDPGQMEQVLLNLTVNARDAMPTGGKLTIETQNAELSEEYAEGHQPVVPGAYVMLAVSDTGIGMDTQTQGRIFEPFFTTKEVSKGTGLGLSTVYGIVKQSGGYIWVYSEPDHGATFKVYLPRVDAPVDAVAPAPVSGGSLAGTETVLLAEDDDLLRPLARGLLQKLGYTVLDAGNAAEALARAESHPGPIHLLIADVVMPGESGRQLARRLAELRPETRVLYVSGYTDDAIVRHGMLEPGLNYLQKPFTPAGFARRVREVLDSK